MDLDVLCIGHAAYDLVFPVDHHPEADEKCFSSGLATAGGGPAANAAVTVARLGGKAAFAGYLGNDLFGTLHFGELDSEGVITDLVIRGEHPTPISAVIVKPDGSRTVVTCKAGTPILQPEQLDFSGFRPRAVLFDGHEPAISVPFAAQARHFGIITILDAGSVHKGTLELAGMCDYLVASEKFARDFSNERDPSKALRSISDIAPIKVITLGSAGCIWAAGDRSGRLPAFKAAAVDSTGAGDIFHGALALRLVNGDNLEAALRYASAAAALGCTRMGARHGIPRKEEVKNFLREIR